LSERECITTENCGELNASQGREMKVVAADLPLFIVEMYTPGEIVEARRSFSAESAADALLAAKGWINARRNDATNFRVVDLDGTIMFDKPVADFN
jgi:hypothetical protein